jgi:site-specific DNA recombinase
VVYAGSARLWLSTASPHRRPWLWDRRLLALPQRVARTWAAAKWNDEHEITEREVTVLLADFATVWSELFPPEQARIVQLMVERVDVREDALEVRIRAEGLASLVGELRQQGERMAA